MLENQALHIASLSCWLVPHTQAHLPFCLGDGYPSNRVVDMFLAAELSSCPEGLSINTNTLKHNTYQLEHQEKKVVNQVT